MTGFLNRLFKRQGKADQPPQEDTSQAAKPKQKSQAFFLDPDDAKSYGDIDYMRTSRTVRRTFMGGKYELVQEVSADIKKEVDEPTPSQPTDSTPASNSTASSPPPSTTQPPRRGGSDMDRFRNMAKDLGKKNK